MPVNGTVDSTANIFAGTTGITVLFTVLFTVPINYLIFEFSFYIFHYTLHKWLYKYHKRHHELIKGDSLLGVGALNMDWIEFIFTLSLPAVVLFTIPLHWHIGFVIFGSWALVDSHSNNPLLKNTQHNIHHKELDKNYGFGLFIFDRLFGTYAVSDAHASSTPVPSHSN